MKARAFIFQGCLVASLLVCLWGCTQKTPAAVQASYDDSPAVISRVDLPIVSIDERPSSESIPKVSLDAGFHVVVVKYPTLLALYHCTFEVDFEAGQTYEIIQRSDRYPVFLNRTKKGTLFTTRLEKFPPRECTKIKRRNDS